MHYLPPLSNSVNLSLLSNTFPIPSSIKKDSEKVPLLSSKNFTLHVKVSIKYFISENSFHCIRKELIPNVILSARGIASWFRFRTSLFTQIFFLHSSHITYIHKSCNVNKMQLLLIWKGKPDVSLSVYLSTWRYKGDKNIDSERFKSNVLLEKNTYLFFQEICCRI